MNILLEKDKIFKDVIYNSIETTYLANLIIDTDIFQRLRHLNQLGVCFLIFPNANNKRFEHSLGVYHLTGHLIDKIIKNSKIEHINNELIKIPFIKNYLTKKHSLNKDGLKFFAHYKNETLFDNFLIELIKIAGLVHDLGHGPFSHLFDEWLKEDPELLDCELLEHESRSKILLADILKTREFYIDGEKQYLNEFIDENSYNFICELIEPNEATPDNFIFQIISNLSNGFDVDKLDYILRDSFYLNEQNPYNLDSIVSQCSVIKGKMCFPEKVSYEIFKVYRSRYDLHKSYYNHKTVISVEFVIMEIFKNIDNIIKIKDDFKQLSLEKFKSLNDDVILFFTKSIRLMGATIDNTTNMEYINKIDDLIKDLNSRNIPKCLYMGTFPIVNTKNPKKRTDSKECAVSSINFVSDTGIDDNIEQTCILETDTETEHNYICDNDSIIDSDIANTAVDEKKSKNKDKSIKPKIVENDAEEYDELKLLKQCSDKNNIPKSKLKLVKKTIGFLSGDKSHPLDSVFFINKKNQVINIPKNNISMCIPLTHKEEIVIIYKMTDNLCMK